MARLRLEPTRAAKLRRAFEVAADGEGQVVGLTGDPGLGKSRLAMAMASYSGSEDLDGGLRADPYRAVCEHLGDVLRLVSRHDEAIEAYRKALAVAGDPLQRAHLHVLCSDADNGAHRYPEGLAQCDLAEQALGPAPDPPGPQWLSSWFEVQDYRMQILYWLNDTEEYGRLIEQVRPFVEAHGSAEQRAYFLLNLVQLALRRDRYLVSDGTVELARAADAAARAADSASYVGFTLGFTLLWHGDLDEATALLEESLQEADRQGSVTLRSRALTYLMAAGRKRGDVDGVRRAVGPVIEQAREASLPEYEAMAIANRAWVAWRSGDEQVAAADAQAALDMWQGLPVRYFFDWMALWPLVAMALASGRLGQAVEHARGMLPPPQQLLQERVRTLVEGSVRAWDIGGAAAAEEMLHAAVRAAGDLAYV